MTKGTSKTRHNRTSKKGKVFPAGKGSKKNSKLPSLKYYSDELRLAYIQDAKPTPSLDANPEEFSEDNDFVVVKKQGKILHYNEMWLDSCWQGLMAKRENRNLTQNQALAKFVKGRLTNLAGKAGYTLIGYSYDPDTGILKGRMEQV